MARTLKREEAAFPSAPDPRFGGNLARANVGKQYSRAFPGGPIGVDRGYENYQAPHRVDYTSPGRSGFRNFTPAYEGTGRPSFEEWQQMIRPPWDTPSFNNPRLGWKTEEESWLDQKAKRKKDAGV